MEYNGTELFASGCFTKTQKIIVSKFPQLSRCRPILKKHWKKAKELHNI